MKTINYSKEDVQSYIRKCYKHQTILNEIKNELDGFVDNINKCLDKKLQIKRLPWEFYIPLANINNKDIVGLEKRALKFLTEEYNFVSQGFDIKVEHQKDCDGLAVLIIKIS